MSVRVESPNSSVAISGRVGTASVSRPTVLVMLPARLVLFALFQVVIAVVFAAQSNPEPWTSSIAWWPLSAVLANVTCLGLLAWAAHREGIGLLDLYRVGPHVMWREALITFGLMAIATPLALVPNILLGNALWGDVARAGDLFFRPLPMWAAVSFLVLFPVTNALAELPTYFGYVQPRLTALTRSRWLPIVLCGLFLAAQHVTLPLIFDARFMVWRLGMFVPFATFVAFVLDRRPRLLPYMMVMHALMDAQLITSVLAVSPA